MRPDEAITVVVATSPVYCNPSTEIVDETYASVRRHLPTARLVLLMDGVHPEDYRLAGGYELFKKSVREKTWENFNAIEFSSWRHQSGMLREFFNLDARLSRPPLVLWMEHDLPLRDLPIDWQGIVDTLLDGEVYGVRFHYDGEGKPSQEGKKFVSRHGVPLKPTVQYVNWPQVLRIELLREFVGSFGRARCYLECSESDGFLAENRKRFPYAYYAPEGDIRRCYHTNGRERGAPLDGNGCGPKKPYVEFDGCRRYV